MTTELWAVGRVRTWTVDEPVTAAGPGDPAIPFVPTASVELLALGFCAPVLGADRPPANVRLTVWRLGQDELPAVVPVRDITPADVPIGLGRLLAAAGPDGSAGAWPPGRYALELNGSASDGRSYVRWLGADVVRLPARGTTEGAALSGGMTRGTTSSPP